MEKQWNYQKEIEKSPQIEEFLNTVAIKALENAEAARVQLVKILAEYGVKNKIKPISKSTARKLRKKGIKVWYDKVLCSMVREWEY